jgi:hypothetical protein
MIHTETEKRRALELLQHYKNQELLGIVNSVSRSGMSRRIEFYGVRVDDYERTHIVRIGYLIAKVIDWPYDVNKGGILAKGCGMDMIFHTLYTFNVVAARIQHPDKTTKELYSNRNANEYFFTTHYAS